MPSSAHVLDSNIAITEPLAESDTDEEYHRYEFLGWTVHVSAVDASDQPEKTEYALWYMRSKLQTIIEVLPLNKVKFLRKVEFWINVLRKQARQHFYQNYQNSRQYLIRNAFILKLSINFFKLS